jgi:hypothetical protein
MSADELKAMGSGQANMSQSSLSKWRFAAIQKH